MPVGDDPTVGEAVDVDAAVALLYAGPPDDFVGGREALARSLRAAGRRDEATAVKALRKPKAVARALDAARLHDPGAVDDLAAAVAALAAAQEEGGDVRVALGALRDAERAVTEAALAATTSDDRAVDASTVGAAVRAVLADPEGLAALRAGRLVDVPSGGGFGPAGFGVEAAAPAEAVPVARPRTGTQASTPAAGPAARRPTTGGRRGRASTAAEEAGAAPPPARTAAASAAPAPAAPARGEPRRLVEARRAVAEAEEALRLAAGAADARVPEVEQAEAAEEAARREADAAARRADEAREAALGAARIATAARREAGALARRRDQAEAALAKARARLAKLEGS